MKRFILCILAAGIIPALAGCHSPPAQSDEPASVLPEETGEPEEYLEPPKELELPPPGTDLPVSSFGEIWAYLLSGREQTLKQDFPLSDVGYFGAELDSYGQLINVPKPGNVSFYKGRLHLVVACNGRALTHFALAEGSRERKALIADLLEAANDFSGLQIDFENVPPKDGEAFLSFLRELRSGLGGKIFTVALPARTRQLKDDVYDYEKIKPLVDRILVMAYDEHWSTSAPGPIASMNWCQRVAFYSLEAIGREKLIMGLPFYGRTWGDINPNRAFLYSGIERIKGEQNVSEIQRENGIPNFKYEVPLSVTVYYEDDYSLSARLEMYRRMGVASVGFWCLGQETPAIWPILKLD
ncbi:glycosyl hydrolase family 18 protein [Leadbettera azotonutricia]|uniref:Spore peptidoglycan hydrolase n=1 Tax=Leadbettera azotonutricia (strain ATCC BAA-888 / DSM 13862 / ZAS-9) TaxID=545695 RepID=F5Y9L5_LEAAZ|nr:glycosyl hydrolase family 18 protein [Leadbettera azotonutricia]AEF82526.1 spore peptidoglycan hydrolase [Leadbettera azotonutricia ZAS-9]